MKRKYQRDTSGNKLIFLSGTQSVKHSCFNCGCTAMTHFLLFFFLNLFDLSRQLLEIFPGSSYGWTIKTLLCIIVFRCIERVAIQWVMLNGHWNVLHVCWVFNWWDRMQTIWGGWHNKEEIHGEILWWSNGLLAACCVWVELQAWKWSSDAAPPACSETPIKLFSVFFFCFLL